MLIEQLECQTLSQQISSHSFPIDMLNNYVPSLIDICLQDI